MDVLNYIDFYILRELIMNKWPETFTHLGQEEMGPMFSLWSEDAKT